jgi:hypothetical protein
VARGVITGLHLAPVMFELEARPPHPAREFHRAYLVQTEVSAGIYQGPAACVRGALYRASRTWSRSASRVTFTSLPIGRTRWQFAATAELEDAQITGVSLCAEPGDLYESRITVSERSGRKNRHGCPVVSPPGVRAARSTCSGRTPHGAIDRRFVLASRRRCADAAVGPSRHEPCVPCSTFGVCPGLASCGGRPCVGGAGSQRLGGVPLARTGLRRDACIMAAAGTGFEHGAGGT